MNDIPQITGPSVLPQDGRAPQQVVIFCHGYGANGADLISLAYPWREVLPDAAFFSPDAPERVPDHPIGYQWWGIGTMSPEERAEGIARAAPVLDAYIEARLEETGLDASRLALVGFSQGTMMDRRTPS